MPFTTAWVGSAPNETVPEFLYSFNLLLWSAAFQWLDYQIRKDNPGVPRDPTMYWPVRVVMYGGYIFCIIMAFVYPIFSLYTLGIFIIILLVWLFRKENKNLENGRLFYDYPWRRRVFLCFDIDCMLCSSF